MTITIPETSEELEELLGDSEKVGALIQAGQFADTIKAYAKKQLEARNGELVAQAKEAMQAGMGEWLKEQAADGAFGGAARPSALSGGVKAPLNLSAKQIQMAMRQKLYQPKAIGAQLNSHEYGRDWAGFLTATWYKNSRNTRYDDFKTLIENAMGERVPSEGGFVVPETLRSDLLMLSLESSVVRPRARVIPMDSLRVPYPTVDDPTHVGQVYGGFVGYWTEEGAALTESQPSFGRIVLEARKLTGYTEIPNELLADAIAAAQQFFGDMAPEAIAFFEDTAFMTGDGVAEPLGVLSPNVTCSVSPARATANEVTFADVAKMYPRMLPQSLNRAIWVCSPDVIGQLLQLVLGTLGAGAVAPPLWLQSMSAAEGIQYTLLGRPLIVTEKCPALGSTGDLSFVDFSYYLLGDRQTMQLSNSEHYKFANDLTAFRIIERVDGRPWLRSALTPANGSVNTLSPIVTLHS